jgi:hypothetical protein
VVFFEVSNNNIQLVQLIQRFPKQKGRKANETKAIRKKGNGNPPFFTITENIKIPHFNWIK